MLFVLPPCAGVFCCWCFFLLPPSPQREAVVTHLPSQNTPPALPRFCRNPATRASAQSLTPVKKQLPISLRPVAQGERAIASNGLVLCRRNASSTNDANFYNFAARLVGFGWARLQNWIPGPIHTAWSILHVALSLNPTAMDALSRWWQVVFLLAALLLVPGEFRKAADESPFTVN